AQEARKPQDDRFLFICVAVRGLEAWFLADSAAITAVLPKVTYAAPPETGDVNAGERIKSLWRQQHPAASFNKIHFASRMAPLFDPNTAMKHSSSFRHFWTRLAARADLSPSGGHLGAE